MAGIPLIPIEHGLSKRDAAVSAWSRQEVGTAGSQTGVPVGREVSAA